MNVFRLAAADQAARARDKAREDPDGGGGIGGGIGIMGKRRPGALEPGQTGPTSLFILSETNVIRRTTKFLIEWPYPNLPRYAQIYSSSNCFISFYFYSSKFNFFHSFFSYSFTYIKMLFVPKIFGKNSKTY